MYIVISEDEACSPKCHVVGVFLSQKDAQDLVVEEMLKSHAYERNKTDKTEEKLKKCKTYKDYIDFWEDECLDEIERWSIQRI